MTSLCVLSMLKSKLDTLGRDPNMRLLEDTVVVSWSFKYIQFVNQALPTRRCIRTSTLRPVPGLQIENGSVVRGWNVAQMSEN